MCKNLSDITNVQDLILSNFDSRLSKKLRKPLASFIKDPLVSLEQKLDFLGQLTQKDSEYFMEVIYPNVQNLLGNAPIPELIKMNEYMLKKYCFLEGENIITSFIGDVDEKKTTTKGIIFLTNYRLIVCGFQSTRSAQKKVRVGGPSLTGMLVRSGITHHRKAITKAITKAFRKDLTEWNIGEWGYYFPIYKARKLNRSNNMLTYVVDIETEKKPISLRIYIMPTRLKKQPKAEFKEQKEYALKQVEDLVKQYQ